MKILGNKNIFKLASFNNNLFLRTNLKFFGTHSHAHNNHKAENHHSNHEANHQEHSHGEHGHGEHGHDDHHGHHEITGEVDFQKVYVKNPEQVSK